jgi:phosphoglycerate dehydrogenase-like enzyme
MMSLPHRFRVALTADFFDAEGNTKYRDIGLDLLKSEPQIELAAFEKHQPEIAPEQLQGVNGVIVLTPRVTAVSLAASQDLLTVGRFGVGFDGVDVAACTAADVALFITAGAVDHSVAEATVAWMLALTHHMRIKDNLVRTGDWDTRSRYMGSELRDRTLGLIGFGGIGQGVVRLLRSFGMKQPLIYDPFVSTDAINQYGVKQVSLDDLLVESDFVSLHCPLNDKTRNMLTSRELGLMKPTAFLLNTARGGIVDEDALFESLSNQRIAGAALDCFVGEPIITPTRWSTLDNVILAPHSIAWTEELFRDIGRSVCNGMLDFSRGRRPRGVINPEVFERPGFIAKWKRISQPL